MKQPYTNDTDKVLHIGNTTLFPGDTRLCEVSDIEAHTGSRQDEVTTEGSEDDPVAEIAKGTVQYIKDAIPGLGDEALDQIEEIENGKESPRRGVIEAITAARLERAGRTDIEEFIASLDGMSDEELEQAVEAHDESEQGYIDALNAEIESRYSQSLKDLTNEDLEAEIELQREAGKDVLAELNLRTNNV